MKMALRKRLSHLPFFKPSYAKRLMFFLFADFFLFFISLHFAYALRFDFTVPYHFTENFYTILVTLTVLKWIALYFNGTYHLTWRYFSVYNAKQIVLGHLTAVIVFFILFYAFPKLFSPLPRSVLFIDFFLSIMLLGALRISKRIILEQQIKTSVKPMLIIGINHKSAALIKSAKHGEIPYATTALIAWNASDFHLCGSSVDGVKIFHPDKIQYLCELYDIQSAAIAEEMSQHDLTLLVNQLASYDVNDIQKLIFLENNQTSLKELSIEELLARHPQDLDSKMISEFIADKTVLITGAGGSIGSEISRQCAHYGAKHLILVDHSEYNLYQIGEQLPDASLKLCNIIDREKLNAVIVHYHPDIIIHAAAYKHVPLCEENIDVAIQNNVIGSCNLIDCAIENSIKKIVIISTDKAVRPTNVMGATKRVVELYAQNVDPKKSEIVAVRFGNVLGSSGSVIPKFKSQIEAGGPVTITHPDITRYFMLISEACQLVLQAATIAKGGELFILDMGQPVKIADLAKTMIKLYAQVPIEIVYTGLRPGEKLYEELLLDESEHKTSYDSITIAHSTHYPIEQLRSDIESLTYKFDKISTLKKIVPEFHHNTTSPL